MGLGVLGRGQRIHRPHPLGTQRRRRFSSPPEPGTLACEIPGYPDSLGLPLRVQFGPGHQRPFFYCAEEQSHPLATDQRHGIDEAKYHAIVDTVMPQ